MRQRGCYYNEIEPFAAQWIRNLAANGLIPAGDVDERDIRDVTPSDVAGYVQCHFFAGIAIWPLALRMAGWEDERRIWTGSCPCQPFSQAGKGDGFADSRHLWPDWHWLIRQCRPVALAGEQVESVAGRSWIDVVSADLEGCGYTCGKVVLPAAGLGAPNIRHRFFWVADYTEGRGRRSDRIFGETSGGGMGNAAAIRLARVAWEEASFGVDLANGQPCSGRPGGRMGDTGEQGLSNSESSNLRATIGHNQRGAVEQPSGPSDPWREFEWIECRDGRFRPTQPGLFPLAHRHSGDVGRLRAYGNSIVPQIATEVIKAWMEVAP